MQELRDGSHVCHRQELIVRKSVKLLPSLNLLRLFQHKDKANIADLSGYNRSEGVLQK